LESARYFPLGPSHLVYGLSQIDRKEDIKKGTMLRIRVRDVLPFFELLSLTASGICLGPIPACRLFRPNDGEPRSSRSWSDSSITQHRIPCVRIDRHVRYSVVVNLRLLLVRNNTQPNDGRSLFVRPH
jgi:hypothetical protein